MLIYRLGVEIFLEYYYIGYWGN